MFGRSKIIRLQEELAALRATLEAQAEQSHLAGQGLREARSVIEKLDGAQRDLNERVTIELAQMRETIDRRIDAGLALENRMLRLEKQIAQQADDIQGAVAGLVARIDGAQRPRKSS
jgi:predicted  nucleic acid-binding Zn-ribbon protein